VRSKDSARVNGSTSSRKDTQRRAQPPSVPKNKPSAVIYNVPPPLPTYKPKLVTEDEDHRIKKYCQSKLDSLVSEVQEVLTNNPPDLCESCSAHQQSYEDKLLISLAGLKQVRDVLKGNVSLDSILQMEQIPSTTSTTSTTSTSSTYVTADDAVESEVVQETPPTSLSTETIIVTKEKKEQISPTTERTLISDLETLDLFGTLPRTKKTTPAPKKPQYNPSSRTTLVFQDPLLGNLDEESLDDIFKS